MATYYFDATNGSNTTGDGSIGNPWQYYDGKLAAIASGDRVLFKRGTTQIVTSIYLGFRSGTQQNPTYYGVYGPGSQKVVWYSTNTWGHILNGANTQYVTIEDFEFNCTNQSSGSIYWAAQESSSKLVTGIILRRCNAYGSISGTGFNFAREDAAITAVCNNCLVEDCNSWDNGSHGFAATGVSQVTFRRCKAWKNGARSASGGHGFSIRALRTSTSSGWTLVSGTIYTKALAANQPDIYYMAAPYPYTRVYKNTTTPTTPGIGEYGVSLGNIYININSNPNGQVVSFAFYPCNFIRLEYCTSVFNIWNTAATYHEGHGFAFDDYSDSSTMVGCYSAYNEGAAYSLNRGDNNTLISCVATSNWLEAVGLNPCDNATIINCSFINNNIGVGARIGEVTANFMCRNGVFTNCYIEATQKRNTYGVNNDPANTGFTFTNCNFVNVQTPVRTGTETNSTQLTNQINPYYRLKASSSLIGAGTSISYTTDNEGISFKTPPSVGAFEYVQPRTFRA